MLLEFRVSNFRSFCDQTIFTMVANHDTKFLDSHTLTTGLSKLPRVVNAAAIFGPNASGKSNLVKALQFMQGMVSNSSLIQPDTENNLAPFRLRENANDLATLMEVTVVINGVRHQYGFEFTRKRILAEWLLVYENSKPRVWFSRSYNGKNEQYSYSDYFGGKKGLWEAATRKEVLFLTTAVQLNSEQLKPVFQKIVNEMVILADGARLVPDFSANFIEQGDNAMRVAALLNEADTGISKVELHSQAAKHIQFDLMNNNSQVHEVEMRLPRFTHHLAGKDYVFEYGDESTGTQIFFGMAGPLLDILDKGKLLVIDELDSSLHPLLVQHILGLFQSKKSNPKNAQIIFTTHDISLLDSNKLRRDQIWLTEKDNEHKSKISPLLDFSPRKGEALDRNYLAGRYGGIPILDNSTYHDING